MCVCVCVCIYMYIYIYICSYKFIKRNVLITTMMMIMKKVQETQRQLFNWQLQRQPHGNSLKHLLIKESGKLESRGQRNNHLSPPAKRVFSSGLALM